MAFKNWVAPSTFGAALVLGYASFAWSRGKRGKSPQIAKPESPPTSYERAPLSDRLERVPEALALSVDPEAELSANNNASPRGAELGALFLGRAASALSPFSQEWPSNGHRLQVPR